MADSFATRDTLSVNGKTYTYCSLPKLGKRFDDRLKQETYAAARGTLVYVDADDFPEAWQLSGRYRKEAGGVRVTAKLFQGDAEKAAFDVLLPADEAAQTETLLAATIKAMAGK